MTFKFLIKSVFITVMLTVSISVQASAKKIFMGALLATATLNGSLVQDPTQQNVAPNWSNGNTQTELEIYGQPVFSEVDASSFEATKEDTKTAIDLNDLDKNTKDEEGKYQKDKLSIDSSEYTFHEYEFSPQHQRVKVVTDVAGNDVPGFVTNSGAVVGINGGFWNDVYSSSIFTQYIRKISSRYGYGGYVPAPSAIVKVGNRLIADNGKMAPALGWTKDGSKSQIGELSTQWMASVHDQTLFNLTRVTALNASDPIKYLYLPSTQNKANLNIIDLRLKINEINKVIEVENVSDKIDTDLTNSYRSTYYSRGDLKKGDTVIIQAQYVSDISGWDSMDYIINGGYVLIQNGRIQEGLDKGEWLGAPRTAVCILASGKWIMVVQPENIALNNLADYFEYKQCQSAMSLDGGPSSYLFMPQPDAKVAVGMGRKISEAIVVMPVGKDYEYVPPSLKLKVEEVIFAIKDNKLEMLQKLFSEDNKLFEPVDYFGYHPLHYAIEMHKNDDRSEIIKFLVNKMQIGHLTTAESAHCKSTVGTKYFKWCTGLNGNILQWAFENNLNDVAEILIRRDPSLLKYLRYLSNWLVLDEKWDLLRLALEVNPRALTLIPEAVDYILRKNTYVPYDIIQASEKLKWASSLRK